MLLKKEFETFIEIPHISYFLKSSYELLNYSLNDNKISGSLKVNLSYFVNNSEDFLVKDYVIDFEYQPDVELELKEMSIPKLQVNVVDNQGVNIYYDLYCEVAYPAVIKAKDDKHSGKSKAENKSKAGKSCEIPPSVEMPADWDEIPAEVLEMAEEINMSSISSEMMEEMKDEALASDNFAINPATLDQIKENIVNDVEKTLKEVLRIKDAIREEEKSFIRNLKDTSSSITVKFLDNERDFEAIGKKFNVSVEDIYHSKNAYNNRLVISNHERK